MTKSSKTKVLVLGKDGMLGCAITKKFENEPHILLTSTSRKINSDYFFDAKNSSLDKLLDEVDPDYIINCIGVIHPRFSLRAFNELIYTNSVFSTKLSHAVTVRGKFLIQIGTDGVFCGLKGNYSENSTRIPNTLYGLSKMIGEKPTPNSLLIRCSIVGDQVSETSPRSLFSWFANLPIGSRVDGYFNRSWNGVTVNVFASLCRGLVLNSYMKGGVQHFVPNDSVSKHQLLIYFQELLNRSDITVTPKFEKNACDRTLITSDHPRNKEFWALAGFDYTPNIKEMVLTTMI